MVQREIVKTLDLKLTRDEEVSIPAGWETIAVLGQHEASIDVWYITVLIRRRE